MNSSEKLDPLIVAPSIPSCWSRNTGYTSPSLTCEVKCGAAAPDIADRRNVHGMTAAERALVKLDKAVKHEKELKREILAFSVSHNHTLVRIYGHNPVIDGDKIIFYPHTIRPYAFSHGEERFTAYRITKNVYDEWMLLQHKTTCSGIDDLPAGLILTFLDLPLSLNLYPRRRSNQSLS